MATSLSTVLRLALPLQLLLLHVLLSPQCIFVANALPITSKPIESTAEKLAWQAWIDLPPEQKNLVKSRKVTPKSIFTLPFRECPPGHQIYESRCILTVNIDQSEVLKQQFLGILNVDGNTDANYDYVEEGEEMLQIFEPVGQRLHFGSVNIGSSNYDDASQLPSQDAPLKFNIFQQKFPTDYETDVGSGASATGGAVGTSTELEKSGEKSAENMPFNVTQFFNAMHDYLLRQQNDTMKSNNQSSSHNIHDNTADLQPESSSISNNFMKDMRGQMTKNAPTTANTDQAHKFSFSDIDAIALPAVPSSPSANTVEAHAGLETDEKHKISLFKDDSTVQLVTTANHAQQLPTQFNVNQLIKADALLSLVPYDEQLKNTEEKNEPTLMHGMQNDSPAPALQTISLQSAEMPIITTLRTESKQKAEIYKEEHTRSATTMANAAQNYEAQEEDFTTTFEPESSTNIQLDETTIFETVVDTTLISPKEQEQDLLLKKSKVEPVATTKHSLVDSLTTTTKRTQEVTLTPTAATPLPSSESEATYAAIISTTNSNTHVTDLYNRFDFADNKSERSNVKQTVGVADVSGNVAASRSQLRNVVSNSEETTTARVTSEIDIQKELRLINELVKGKKQLQRAKTTTTEATIATTDKKTTSAIKNALETTTTSTTTTIETKSLPASTTSVNDVAVETTSVGLKFIDADKVVATTLKNDLTTATLTTFANSRNSAASESGSNNEAVKFRTTTTSWTKVMPTMQFETNIKKKNQTTDSSLLDTTTRVVDNTNNRSNRNSKIFRINNANENEARVSTLPTSTTSTKSTISTTSTTKAENESTNSITSTTTATMAKTTTTSTNVATTADDSIIAADHGLFSWLPAGWSLDRTPALVDTGEESSYKAADIVLEQQADTVDAADAVDAVPDDTRSLLLRFWSAFPSFDEQAKV